MLRVLRVPRQRYWFHTDGNAAVEFAIIAPLFVMLMFGIICFGTYFGIYNGVEQLAAESARASVGGLSTSERDQLARSYVSSNMGAYPFLDPTKLAVTTSGSATAFQVSIAYDLSGSFIYDFSGLLSLPSSTLTRSAAIQLSAY